MKKHALTAFLLKIAFSLTAQPVLVADFNPGGADGMYEYNFQAHYLGDLMIFPAISPDAGLEPAVLEDGEMRLLKDINPGAEDSGPESFVAFNSRLYFVADDGQNGSSIWSTDGTEAGTTLAIALNGLPGARAEGLTATTGNGLFFTYGGTLYRSADGSDVEEVLTNVNFEAEDGKGSENYSTYGEGIAFLRKANSTTLELYAYDGALVKLGQDLESSFLSNVYGLGEVAGGLVFAQQGGFTEPGLDATFAYNAAQDTIIEMSVGKCDRFLNLDSQRRIGFIDFTNTFYALTADPLEAAVLVSGVDPGLLGSSPIEHAVAAGKTVFHADHPSSFKEFVAMTGGTGASTTGLITTDRPFLSNMIAFGRYVFFAAGIQNGFDAEIFYVDTEMGTTHSIYEYPDNTGGDKSVQPVGVQNGRLYFASAVDGAVGRELYSIETGIAGLSSTGSLNAPADVEFQFLGSEFVVRSTKSMPIGVKVYDASGRLLRTLKTRTNVMVPAVPVSGLLFYQVEGDGWRLTGKGVRP
ncbi:MAG: hypothetical protein H6560_28410 [Lewinellaceae bacterium]|nr:hypothetical protein [Lewinellaceae bacterium]